MRARWSGLMAIAALAAAIVAGPARAQTASPPSSAPCVGLVRFGGGALGVAHIGVIEVL